MLLSILISQSWENNLMFRGIIIITIIITIIFIIIIILIIIMNSQSWENNLVFYGINIMKDEEHNPDLITGRVRVVFTQMHKIQTIVINKYKYKHNIKQSICAGARDIEG